MEYAHWIPCLCFSRTTPGANCSYCPIRDDVFPKVPCSQLLAIIGSVPVWLITVHRIKDSTHLVYVVRIIIELEFSYYPVGRALVRGVDDDDWCPSPTPFYGE